MKRDVLSSLICVVLGAVLGAGVETLITFVRDMELFVLVFGVMVPVYVAFLPCILAAVVGISRELDRVVSRW